VERLLPKASELLSRLKKQCQIRFDQLTSGPPPGGDKDARLKRIMNDTHELSGVRNLAAAQVGGRKREIKAELDKVMNSSKTEAEYMAKLQAVAADHTKDAALRSRAVHRLNMIAKAAQEAALMKCVGEVSVQAALVALPKHLRAAKKANDILEIEALLNRTKAVMALAVERDCPPPAPELVNLVQDLDKQRAKLEGGEKDNLDACLKKLQAANLTWGLLECYDVVCDFPIDTPCMGIVVTEKMDQICERRCF